jgi:hypothetical protein
MKWFDHQHNKTIDKMTNHTHIIYWRSQPTTKQFSRPQIIDWDGGRTTYKHLTKVTYLPPLQHWIERKKEKNSNNKLGFVAFKDGFFNLFIFFLI